MPFQATLNAQSLKVFTKCLTCLARYGDDILLQADLGSVSLSSTNSSKSAFGQIKFNAAFFEKYHARASQPPGSTFRTPPSQQDPILGQLVVKSLLSILRHKTIDKIIERCRLSILDPGRESEDGDSDEEKEEKDSLELKLIVRLYCKHGIVKTHRLALLTPTNALTPRIPSMPSESRVVIGPRALKDVLEHFSRTKGPKHDPQLLWMFGLNDVKVKTHQFTTDGKGGKSQHLSTEISINADEFDLYQIHDPPSGVGFHLKEFNATIALAEALSTALIMRFTEPTEPILIEFESDVTDYEFLFIVSTTNSTYDHVPGSNNNLRKRQRVAERTEARDTEMENSEDGSSSRTNKRRPECVVGPSRPLSAANSTGEGSSVLRSSNVYKEPSPNLNETDTRQGSIDPQAQPLSKNVSLFLPGASQASDHAITFTHGASGVEHLAYEDFEAMMDAEGTEVGMSTKVGIIPVRQHGQFGGADPEEDSHMEEGTEMFPATQPSTAGSGRFKPFQPLFED